MQVLLEHTTPALPVRRRRDVVCIIEHAYRDLDLADRVCEGIFTNAGLTLELGTRPDWRSERLPKDEEWKIEWYKFYFGLNLAHAFTVTGDEKYLVTWQRLVESWILQMPLGCDSTDVAARRLQNWIYAWNIFARTTVFDFDFENRLVSALAAHVRHVLSHLTAERNHRTLELYALFIAALALPELNDNNLLGFAINELHRNLLTDVRRDGVHREQSTHYHMTALRSFLGARENARRFALQFPATYDDRLEKACEFLLHVQRPDGFIPALSDADTGNYSDLLELGALIFERSDFLYAATSGALGVRPAETCASFAEGGYFIQRSGWGDEVTDFCDEKYLVFDCGPLGDGGHGHYDLLNIEVSANGKPLLVDPGRFTYAEDPARWRHWFKGTAAHNTVCVDDLDQTPYRRGKPKDALAQGCLLARFTAPGLDMLCGEVRSPVYDAVHTRRIFFIAGEYWLIVDSLRGLTPHKFDLRFHLTAAAWNHCSRIEGTRNTGIRTPDLALLFEPHRRPVLSQGWVSKIYGVREVAPVVSVVAEGCERADFYTVIAPLKLASQLPQFEVIANRHVRVQWARNVDDVAWTDASAHLQRNSLLEGVAR